MPQLTKGGKYVFGWSRIREDGAIYLPPEAIREYQLAVQERVILISGSKTSGGIVVANRSWLEKSALAGLFEAIPGLVEFRLEPGELRRYKGRLYGWAGLELQGKIRIPFETLGVLALQPGDLLLSIRGSNLAFVLAARGPLVAKAREHPEIEVFG